jgi:hypothetical protein
MKWHSEGLMSLKVDCRLPQQAEKLGAPVSKLTPALQAQGVLLFFLCLILLHFVEYASKDSELSRDGNLRTCRSISIRLESARCAGHMCSCPLHSVANDLSTCWEGDVRLRRACCSPCRTPPRPREVISTMVGFDATGLNTLAIGSVK